MLMSVMVIWIINFFISVLKVMNAKREEKEPLFEELCTLADQLPVLCQADLDEVEADFASTKKNRNDVTDGLQQRQSHVTHMTNKLKEFDDLAKLCKNKLTKFENIIADINQKGIDSEGLDRLCEDVDKMHKKVIGLGPKVESVESLANEMQDYHTHSNCEPIRSEANDIRSRYDDLIVVVSAKAEDLPVAAKEVKDLGERLKSMVEKVNKLTGRVDGCRPKKLEVDEVATNLAAIKVCYFL